ncbi:hypothetical protein OESDEN_25276 [Oesophagostomum dentatum]|uniref:Uncharacterized protein n=1 Tax=Oesophagostomum dentatum TaxID=61180 RepID=A0A0B1RPX1_OESDE|nr:hypothetical protein OESDEN_25276 [Oesophagostomum dentatum]
MTDIETLKTLTPEQREALVNIIRNSSLLDHSLSHLQQALVGQQVIHAHNATLSRQSPIGTTATSAAAPNIADMTFSQYGTSAISAASAISRRHSVKRRSNNVHNSSWIV